MPIRISILKNPRDSRPLHHLPQVMLGINHRHSDMRSYKEYGTHRQRLPEGITVNTLMLPDQTKGGTWDFQTKAKL